ncbi:unnamed protein product [Lactuca virosa]|uniref:Uncharacterized protein n=1 Tax=Lactuca virosa TaxID=75947 RepID=A0AAU9M1B7_9ASTR|nr:unnamed protein product [Lactuca virosa]
MSASVGRSIKPFVFDTMEMMNNVPCSSATPSCKFFLWKDDEIEEGYYKDQLCKMRYELRKKEDYSEVVKA